MKPLAIVNLPASLLAAAVLLALALPVLELEVPELVKFTVELETEKDWDVSVSVIPEPLTQTLDVPGAP